MTHWQVWLPLAAAPVRRAARRRPRWPPSVAPGSHRCPDIVYGELLLFVWLRALLVMAHNDEDEIGRLKPNSPEGKLDLVYTS